MNFISCPFKIHKSISSIYGIAKFSGAGIVIEYREKYIDLIDGELKEIRIPRNEINAAYFRKGFFPFSGYISVSINNLSRALALLTDDGTLKLKVKRKDIALANLAIEALHDSFLPNDEANLLLQQPLEQTTRKMHSK
ncbi:MAG: hypothetical protein ACK5NT_12535 [Pyrinomonadaceae bacterium]